MGKSLFVLLAVAVIASLVPSTQQQQCISTLDIVFLVDGSNSMGIANFRKLINTLTNLLTNLTISEEEVHVGVVLFSSSISAVIELTWNQTELLSELRDIEYPDEETITYLALNRGEEMCLKSSRTGRTPCVIMLITDGQSTSSTKSLALESAARIKSRGVKIYGIGITNATDVKELSQIASSNDMVFVTQDFVTLEDSLNKAAARICVDLQTAATTSVTVTAPPPVPACFMGETDLWLLVDVSSRTESLARGQTTGDFQTLKNGLTKMADIIQDPSVSNPGVSLGLIAYSDVAKVLSDIEDEDSVVKTVSAIQQLPGEVAQGGSSLIQALNNIKSAPVNSSYRSYVAIVGPESSFSYSDELMEELARLKKLGFTIAIFLVSESGSLDIVKLQREASGSRFFYRIAGFSDLEAATKNFTRDRLCHGMVSNTTGLCEGSGHRELGVGVVSHPTDCDKYIQCYYDPINDLDLAVVRQCPAGLHWNLYNQTCSKPSQGMCSTDRCLEDCSERKAYGACGAYWECHDGMSEFKCCPLNFTFVPDVGCQFDAKCTDKCIQAQWCGKCQKKPNWEQSAGYDVMPLGGNTWMPRPCFYDDFDIVDCDCAAPRDHVCPADREFDFTHTDTLSGALAGTKEGIRVTSVQQESEGISLGSQSSVHVKVDKAESEDKPFTLELKFREMDTFSPYGEVLVSSGLACGGANSLLITATDQFVFAEVRADGQVAEVKVPTQGLAKEEFKKLLLSLDNGVLALSISDSKTQYIATTDAPSNICFSCGLDFGRGVNKLSFEGEVQKIAFYSCAWKTLYETED